MFNLLKLLTNETLTLAFEPIWHIIFIYRFLQNFYGFYSFQLRLRFGKTLTVDNPNYNFHLEAIAYYMSIFWFVRALEILCNKENPRILLQVQVLLGQ